MCGRLSPPRGTAGRSVSPGAPSLAGEAFEDPGLPCKAQGLESTGQRPSQWGAGLEVRARPGTPHSSEDRPAEVWGSRDACVVVLALPVSLSALERQAGAGLERVSRSPAPSPAPCVTLFLQGEKCFFWPCEDRVSLSAGADLRAPWPWAASASWAEPPGPWLCSLA